MGDCRTLELEDVLEMGSGSGWINEHFINDGSAINQPSPGAPPCSTSTPTPPVVPPAPPQTWNETAGSVAHTWTNYTNAGGTQGPSIGSGQTVAIACRLQGFQVADGYELWWNNDGDLSSEGLWGNTITLSSRFVQDVLDSPIPIDLRSVALMAKHGPMAMDILAWMNYRLPSAKRPSIVTWDQLHLQSGGNRRRDTNRRHIEYIGVGYVRSIRCASGPSRNRSTKW